MTATTESRVQERIERERAELAETVETQGNALSSAVEAYNKADANVREAVALIQSAGPNGNLVGEELRDKVQTLNREAMKALAGMIRESDGFVKATQKLARLDDPAELSRRIEAAEALANVRREGRKPSGKDAAIAVLLREGRAMHYRDITQAAQESGLVELGGKTPEATMNAMLAVSSKAEETFTKVAPGVFDLIDREAAAAQVAPTEPTEQAGADAEVEKAEPQPKTRDRKAAAKKAAATRKRNAAAKAKG